MYDINQVREDFPILSRKIYDKPLVYFDNAATTQKPLCVLDAMREEYLNVNANVHRGVHWMSQQATELHEQARETVRRFLNAKSTTEIVFTRGTTEGLNLVASTFADECMQKGDEVIVSTMEHHSNIVPWQLQARKKGIVLKVIPMSDDGILDMEAYKNLFTEKTRIVSVCHVSNVLGTVNPVKDIVRIAHEHGVPVMVDGAQSAPHFKVDVQDIDCDFFVFSGHKVYGPTGIGVLYGKEAWLEKLPPYQGGGEMIEHVSFEHTTFERPPLKFEAGTPDYIASHGLAVALDYVSKLGMDNIAAHEQELTRPLCHPAASGDTGDAYLWSYCSGRDRSYPVFITILSCPRRCRQLQCRQYPPHGLGYTSRPLGHCRPYGSSLCTAVDGPSGRVGNRACFLCAV